MALKNSERGNDMAAAELWVELARTPNNPDEPNDRQWSLLARKMAEEFAAANNCTVHYETYPGVIFFRKIKPNEVVV